MSGLFLKRRDYITCLSFFLIGILSRIPFLERMQSHWDGPDYTLALIHYSFVEQTPSPPGYPIYIAIGRLFLFFTRDPHLAILAVSVLFSGIGAVFFYLTGKAIFNKKTGILSALIFLSAPTTYYFGITANPYGILPTTAASVGAVVFLIMVKKKKLGLLLGFVTAFAIGIRPQDALFLLPLYACGIWYLEKKEKIISLLSVAIVCLTWIIPTAVLAGGLSKYLSYVFSFANHDARPDISLSRIAYITPILIKGLYLTCGIASLASIIFIKRIYFAKAKKQAFLMARNPYILLFLLWIAPSLSFNLFVRSDHAAHQMAYLSGLIVLSSHGVVKIFGKKKRLFIAISILIVVYNLYTFFRNRDPNQKLPYVSQSYHYSEIVKNNSRMPAIINFVKTFNPKETIVITDPEIFRPVMYYLINYYVYAYSSLDTTSPSSYDSVHFGYLWHYKYWLDKQHTLTVPESTRYIIVISNNRPYSFVGVRYKKVTLTSNALLYILSVDAGDIYHLSVHSFTKTY